MSYCTDLNIKDIVSFTVVAAKSSDCYKTNFYNLSFKPDRALIMFFITTT